MSSLPELLQGHLPRGIAGSRNNSAQDAHELIAVEPEAIVSDMLANQLPAC
jgi:hypothetical protein